MVGEAQIWEVSVYLRGCVEASEADTLVREGRTAKKVRRGAQRLGFFLERGGTRSVTDIARVLVTIGVIGFLLDGLMRRLERLDEVRWRYET